MKPQTLNPNEADLHAMNILIESAASESPARPIAPEPYGPEGISALWDLGEIGYQLATVTAERDRWRRVAQAWPWVAAGLVFGWGMTVWGWLGR